MTMAASIVCRDDLRTLLLVACRRDGDHVVLHDVLRQPWIAYVGDDGSAWLAAPPSRRMATTEFGALLRASELSICVSAAETWRFPMTVLAVPPHARAHVPETVQLDDVDEVDPQQQGAEGGGGPGGGGGRVGGGGAAPRGAARGAPGAAARPPPPPRATAEQRE
jgi:uncharacterized membrane protein YgcG